MSFKFVIFAIYLSFTVSYNFGIRGEIRTNHLSATPNLPFCSFPVPEFFCLIPLGQLCMSQFKVIRLFLIRSSLTENPSPLSKTSCFSFFLCSSHWLPLEMWLCFWRSGITCSLCATHKTYALCCLKITLKPFLFDRVGVYSEGWLR